MEAELMTLATAGATALVQQMVGDGWEQVKGRIVAFFARRAGTDPAVIEDELDTVRAELLAAEETGDERTTADAQAEARTEWRARMRRTLQADPEAAAELRDLLDEMMPRNPAPTTITTHNTMNDGVNHGSVIQAGVIVRNYGAPGA
ncbi:hypothetical protein AB0A69_03370 [Streptomyces sp. NPDC045431]|uniref:hypothetical protein n=1 Tax=Streptomyces sp. NPDC045431 TaxID=3155613 RepID=UPI0033CAE9BF